MENYNTLSEASKKWAILGNVEKSSDNKIKLGNYIKSKN